MTCNIVSRVETLRKVVDDFPRILYLGSMQQGDERETRGIVEKALDRIHPNDGESEDSHDAPSDDEQTVSPPQDRPPSFNGSDTLSWLARQNNTFLSIIPLWRRS